MREFKTERTLVETDRVYEWKLPEAMERLFGGPTAMPVGAVIGFRVCEADIANDEPERLQLVVTTIEKGQPVTRDVPAYTRPEGLSRLDERPREFASDWERGV